MIRLPDLSPRQARTALDVATAAVVVSIAVALAGLTWHAICCCSGKKRQPSSPRGRPISGRAGYQREAGPAHRRLCPHSVQRSPVSPGMLLTERTVIARRAALALRDGAVVNFGAGLSKAVAAVADAEGILDRIGSSVRRDAAADAAIDGPARFGSCGTDGVDQAFLDMAEVDRRGNVDVGRFGATTAGTGGIIDISQGAACVYFLGTFISGGQRIRIQGGALEIEREGTRRKFVDRVQRLTFNGACATERGQQIFYVTERAVFRLTGTGLELIEIAPGVQVEKHILRSMDFEPRIASNLRLMDGRIFRTERMVPGGMA